MNKLSNKLKMGVTFVYAWNICNYGHMYMRKMVVWICMYAFSDERVCTPQGHH